MSEVSAVMDVTVTTVMDVHVTEAVRPVHVVVDRPVAVDVGRVSVPPVETAVSTEVRAVTTMATVATKVVSAGAGHARTGNHQTHHSDTCDCKTFHSSLPSGLLLISFRQFLPLLAKGNALTMPILPEYF